MSRYLSLLGMVFLGVGMVALASVVKAAPHSEPAPQPPSGTFPPRQLPAQPAAVAVPSFHARFSLN